MDMREMLNKKAEEKGATPTRLLKLVVVTLGTLRLNCTINPHRLVRRYCPRFGGFFLPNDEH